MKLVNGHIIIDADIANSILEGDKQLNLVYYPERNQLLFASKSKTFFEKLHKTKWMTLKDKNIQGDKALFVREILIDNDLDLTDRNLIYEIKTNGIVTVTL